MPHMDEGRLHAWLDRDRSGLSPRELEEIAAHLAVCATCAAEVERQRELRERVEEIFSGSETPIAVPDFAELRARARRGREGQAGVGETSRGGQAGVGETGGGQQAVGQAGRDGAAARLPRGGRRTRPWLVGAWAASLVGAVALGWSTRDLVRPGAGADEAASSQATSSSLPAALSRQPLLPITAPEAADPAGAIVAEGDPPGAAAGGSVATGADVGGTVSPGADVGERVASGAAAGESVASRADVGESVARGSGVEESAALPSGAGEPVPPGTGRVEAAAAAFLPGYLVVQGRVVDEQGAPLPATQVFEAGSGVGVLTEEDGTFSLTLPGARGADGPGVSLTARRLGFEGRTVDVATGGADTAFAEIQLDPARLALSGIIAAEARPEGAPPLAEGLLDPLGPDVAWRPVARAEAERELGLPILTAAGLGLREIELGELDGMPVVRVFQELEGGGTVALIQRRAPAAPTGPVAPTVPVAPGDPSADAPPVLAFRGDNDPIPTLTIGGLRVTASGPLPADSLQAILRNLR